jgi:RecA-family ATPase
MVQLDKNLKIIPMGEVLPLDHPEGQKFLEALIEEFEPDGIILDSMGKVTNESLSDERKAKELNAYYAKIRKKHDLFLWFIHHNRKANGDNKKPKELSDIYGNQYLSADLTVALSLWKEEGSDHIDVNTIKTRLGPEQATIHIKRNENLIFQSAEAIADSILGSPLVKEELKDAGHSDGDETPGVSTGLFGM